MIIEKLDPFHEVLQGVSKYDSASQMDRPLIETENL